MLAEKTNKAHGAVGLFCFSSDAATTATNLTECWTPQTPSTAPSVVSPNVKDSHDRDDVLPDCLRGVLESLNSAGDEACDSFDPSSCRCPDVSPNEADAQALPIFLSPPKPVPGGQDVFFARLSLSLTERLAAHVADAGRSL
eukprot:Polyplicarium_translucidae@DN1510_c0_g1_i1.p2